MELIKSDPNAVELANLGPWFSYMNSIIAPSPSPQEAHKSLAFFDAYAEILTGIPRRILLYGPGNLVSASEYSLDLFRSLTTTISGLEPGHIDDEHAEIRYHPALHPCDAVRLAKIADGNPDTSFLIVATDLIVSGGDWVCAPLNPLAALPFPMLCLLRWLHAEWGLSDVEPRIEILRRWAFNFSPEQKLKVIK